MKSKVYGLRYTISEALGRIRAALKEARQIQKMAIDVGTSD